MCLDTEKSLADWWKFDEKSGSRIAVNSVSGRSPLIFPENKGLIFQPGRIGNALRFVHIEGERPFAENFSLSIKYGFTAALFINAAPADVRIDSGAAQMLLTIGENMAEGYWEISLSGNGELCFYSPDCNNGKQINSNRNVVDGRIHHVAVTYNGNKFRFYDDGQMINETISDCKFSDLPQRLTVGARADGEFPYRGLIDDLRLYTSALSSVEIEQLACSGDVSESVKTKTDCGRLYGIERLLETQQLPLIEQTGEIHYAGSIAKCGDNTDWDWGIYQDENGEWVLMEADGAGCIYNFTQHRYPTSEPPIFKFYFDGMAEPAFSLKPEEFGTKYPFVSPLADRYFGPVDNGNGPIWVVRSFVPMAFRTHCKVTSTIKLEGCFKAKGEGGWGHVMYHTFPTADGIVTFTGKEDYSSLIRRWNNIGVPLKYMDEQIAEISPTVLKPEKSTVVYKCDGSRIINQFKIKLGSYKKYLLTNLWVKMTWDGHHTPDVEAPIGTLFGNQYGARGLNTLMTGMNPQTGEFYLYFPLPFWKSAVIQLENRGKIDVTLAGGRVVCSAQSLLQAKSGYFTSSKYYPRTENVPGYNSVIASLNGCGHMVYGCLAGWEIEYGCEGDVRVFIDGKRSPVVESDGSESWASYGWGFVTPAQFNPISAYDGLANSNSTWSMQRAEIGDSYFFKSSLRFELEHGCTNDGEGQHSGQIFAYMKDSPGMVLTDSLKIGDLNDEAAHSYKIDGTSEIIKLKSTFANGLVSLESEATGRNNFTGEINFQVKVSEDNNGVVLHRLSDQSNGRQSASVYLDGRLVSEQKWYVPDSNKFSRWLDDEFLIPSEYTASKSLLKITIKPLKENSWNEFSYDVFSIK